MKLFQIYLPLLARHFSSTTEYLGKITLHMAFRLC